MEYIDKNYMNSDVSLNSVCSYLAMSTSYFSTLFKTTQERPLSRRSQERGWKKAKNLLETTSKRAYEVAGGGGIF